MSLASAAQAQLLDQLSHLHSDQNPYRVIAAYLRSQLFPTVPASAIYQLYFVAAALGVTALLVLASLVLRWTKGIFWVFRMQQQPRVIRPHWSICWSLIAFVMLVLFEVVIAYAIHFYRQQADRGFGYVFLLVWSVAWLGGSAAAWSLAVSYILHIQATTQRSVDHLAIISNVAAVVVPVAYLAILLPFGCLAGRGYSDAVEVFQGIDAQLVAEAATWKRGDAFSPFELAPLLPLFQEMVDNFETFLKWFKPTFIFYGVTALLLTIGLVSVAYFHLSSLRRMLRGTHQHSMDSQERSASAMTGMSRRVQHKRVEQTLRSLLLTILLFSFLGLLFTAVSIYAAASPESLITSPMRAQLVILLPLYAFAIFGLPCAVMLVLRAHDAVPAEETTSEGLSGNRRPSVGSRTAGLKNGIRFGSAGESAPKGNEFSIQLASIPSVADAATNSSGSGGGSRRNWLRRVSGDARGAQWDGSVSVTVDVDVVVEDEAEFDEKVDAEKRRGELGV